MPLTTTANKNYPVPGFTSTDKKADDFTAIKDALTAIDADMVTVEEAVAQKADNSDLHIHNNSAVLEGLTYQHLSLTQPGELQIFGGTSRWYPPAPVTLIAIEAYVSVPSVGSDITFDLKKNGITVYSGVIAVGQQRLAPVAISVDLTTDDYLTLDVTGVGSTTPGSDLVVRSRLNF